MKKISTDAGWIWCDNNQLPDDKVVFRKKFTVVEPPAVCPAILACDTKYWLYLNGKQVVFEGGLFRESVKGSGYADTVDLAPFIQSGENTLSVLAWFYGNGGRNNVNSTRAGFLFDCGTLNLKSDNSFLCRRHPAFYKPDGEQPAYLYGGHSIGFDANQDFGDFTAPDFEETGFLPAAVYCNTVWGELYERPIPLHKISESRPCADILAKGSCFTIKLPYAMQVHPELAVDAAGGEKIDIRTDRYYVKGGPGDTNTYNGHRIEYICKPGINRFSSPFYLFGEQLHYTCSAPLTIRSLSYKESGYHCNIVGSFHSDQPLADRLIEKAARTLYVCMRDNFMDCPDRERGQWIGDVSVQVPQVAFLLDHNAHRLLKKAIYDFINLRCDDVLVGNVPGEHYSELPSQSLNAISEHGLIANYYKYTGDSEILSFVFEPAVRYMMLWSLTPDGLIQGRSGDWRWFDHLYNVDDVVLENAWYYSALRFLTFAAERTGSHQHDSFLSERKAAIEEAFHAKFFRGGYYSSSGTVDDRANAMAVLSHLCPRECYEHIRNVLCSVSNATVYMEGYVLSALCRMGYHEDAYKRMMSRYYNLAINENSTLWEDFYLLGTKNHAWSGSPATIIFRYFLGVDTNDGFENITVSPDRTVFQKMQASFPGKNGMVHLSINNHTGETRLENNSVSKINIIN